MSQRWDIYGEDASGRVVRVASTTCEDKITAIIIRAKSSYRRVCVKLRGQDEF